MRYDVYIYIYIYIYTYIYIIRLLKVNEKCALLGYYAVSSDNSLPTFHDDLSDATARINNYRHRKVVDL